MLKQGLYNYKETLDREGILFSFSGPISHSIVEGLGSMLQGELEEDGVDKTTAMKVFAIFVEQVQNVIHYSQEREKPDSDLSRGIIVVGKNATKYFIIGGNKIKTTKVPLLDEQLSQLVTMNQEQLKKLYKEKRRLKKPQESKGAGIGFIEMARKASEPLVFKFDKINDEYSFFSLEARI